MISKAVIQTLQYSDHFGFPLTFEELHLRLVQFRCSKSQLDTLLSSMVISKLIQKKGEYYHLPGRAKVITQRTRNLETSKAPLIKARKWSKILGKVSGVLAIYLTGSLAMSNSTQNSDIDFLIITKNNQLWTTRFVLTIYTSLLGLRRTPQSKQHTGKLCLNLYLTPQSFLLPPSKRSLYTAYELIQATPLYDPQNTQSALLSTNTWIHNYLPNFPIPKPTMRLPQENGKTGMLEYILYNLQLLYMKNKITREHITKGAAFFHPNNPGDSVLKKISL